MRAPQASLDWRYLSIWDQNCQLLRRNGVKRRRNTKSKSQTALIYISLVFDIIFVENSLHSLYRTTWAWYLKGRESENANDKSEMFDWYLIRMVLMYISFSSFPFFYSSHRISAARCMWKRVEMTWIWHLEISDSLPQSTPLASHPTI